jgi:hypothetical protein
MTEKATGNPRVGCGSYEWTFDRGGDGLATSLVIAIEQMEVFDPGDEDRVLAPIARLEYPWTSPAAVIEATSASAPLAFVARFAMRAIA